MKQTTNYKLTYYEKDDLTTSQQEMQRWETLDNQLIALFNIVGNGVLNGWNLIASSGLSVVVTAGSGFVYFVSVQSNNNVSISLTASARNYIYASLSNDSYWTQNVIFSSSVYTNTNDNVLLLGYVDTNANSIVDINTDGKTTLGFINLVNQTVKNHRHIGGTENPSQINLATDVQGLISQSNLPSLDASVIQSGTLITDVIPTLDHNTKLSDIGTLTHSQLDDFVNTLSIPDQSTMGEVSTANLLQLILAVKHIYPDIDKYLVNEISFIPGISPNSYIDTVNTTAIVDTNTASQGGLHTIKAANSTGFTTYTKTWATESDFISSSNSYNIVVNGDSVTLATKENTFIIDEFNDISLWQVEIQDLSSIPATLTSDTSTYVVPPNSGKLTVGNESVEIMLKIVKDFAAQDWSSYNYLIFSINTTSVQHGDLFFYLNDNTYGIQNSYTKVLSKNAPTINNETLENGWQEVTVDIRNFNRQNINEIGFYVSTQNGWDTSKGFSLNIDNIYLTSGNLYQNNGYIRFIFGSDFLYDFYRVRWDDIVPTDSASAGVQLSTRIRCANSLVALASASWYPYDVANPYVLPIPAGQLYGYIEVEFSFIPSYTLNRSIILKKAYLDFYATDTDYSFNYVTQSDWNNGYQFNIDTSTYANSIAISNISEIGDYSYGTNGSAIETDQYLVEKAKITGSMLPRSTYQVLNGISPSFGTITGIVRGNNGNVWLSDTENDRIVQVDDSGTLVSGFMGSFLTDPEDPYETGNVASSTNSSTISVLHSLYNYNEGALYIVCSSDLENIYLPTAGLDLNNMYLKIGGHRIYLNDADVSLLGFDIDKYNLWSGFIGSSIEQAQNLNLFSYYSNVLKIKPTGANRTLLDNIVTQFAPTVVISTPLAQQMTSSNVNINLLTYNFELGTQPGEQAIRITLDGGTPTIIYSTNYALTGIAQGSHTLKAELLQSNSSSYTNIEAVANGSFVVNTGVYTQPYITILSPRPNQVYSSSPVTIEFSIQNFAVTSSGQHLRYSVDGGTGIDVYNIAPIVISDLTAGKHAVTIYTVDENGNQLVYAYGSATIEFIVGLNSNALVQLYVQEDAIYGSNSISCSSYSGYVDVANMYLKNIYSPVDVQINKYRDFTTVLAAKIRSPAWTECLGGIDNYNEFYNRLVAANVSVANVTASTNTSTNPYLAAISTENLVFQDYVDGHSIVELNECGKTIFSNNDAKIATTKDVALNILGSCDITGVGEILIADAWNKRAIITYTDPNSRESTIQWEYDSDRYISDFHLSIQDNIVINIYDGYIDINDLTIRSGSSVTWVNKSSIPISIWSGQTTYANFNANPDFNLYGDDFSSNMLQVGESFTFKFYSSSMYYWFAYPSILTGVITSVPQRITDRDQYIILENDGLDCPFSSRVIKSDSYGNILWNFGQGYLCKPRDARPLINGNVLIST